MEATEFTVKAMESESRQVSIKRNKSNLEGGVAIEMSAQPLLELTPMPGSEYRTRLSAVGYSAGMALCRIQQHLHCY